MIDTRLTIPAPRIVAVIKSRGVRYFAYTEAEAYHIRDTVGGDIEWAL